MPYISEALWSDLLRGSEKNVLALSRWPAADFSDDAADAEINWLVSLVSAVRSVRSEMNVPPAAKTALVIVGGTAELPERVKSHASALERLARIEVIERAQRAPNAAVQIVVGGATFALPLAGIVDFTAEKARLEKEIARVEGEIGRIDKKLANENFVARAPEEVVEAEREKRAAYAVDGERLAAALKRVAGSA